MKLDYPYKVEISTVEDGIAYLKNQCNNCPRYNGAFDCSGATVAKCNEVKKQVEKECVMQNYIKMLQKNPNNFSNWFPKIENCDKDNELQMPRSIIITTPPEIIEAYFEPHKNLDVITDFVKNTIIPAIPDDMFFLFVKNGTFSNKFENSCFCRKSVLEIAQALIDINYTAEMLGAGGMSEIIIREYIGGYYGNSYLPLIYNGLPLRPEFRVFYDFDKKEVLYTVNYWDYDYCYETIKQKTTDKIVYEYAYPHIEHIYNKYKDKVTDMVAKAMKSVDMQGKWSIDVMYQEEEDAFWLIDMAVAEDSAYWREE